MHETTYLSVYLSIYLYIHTYIHTYVYISIFIVFTYARHPKALDLLRGMRRASRAECESRRRQGVNATRRDWRTLACCWVSFKVPCRGLKLEYTERAIRIQGRRVKGDKIYGCRVLGSRLRTSDCFLLSVPFKGLYGRVAEHLKRCRAVGRGIQRLSVVANQGLL